MYIMVKAHFDKVPSLHRVLDEIEFLEKLPEMIKADTMLRNGAHEIFYYEISDFEKIWLTCNYNESTQKASLANAIKTSFNIKAFQEASSDDPTNPPLVAGYNMVFQQQQGEIENFKGLMLEFILMLPETVAKLLTPSNVESRPSSNHSVSYEIAGTPISSSLSSSVSQKDPKKEVQDKSPDLLKNMESCPSSSPSVSYKATGAPISSSLSSSISQKDLKKEVQDKSSDFLKTEFYPQFLEIINLFKLAGTTELIPQIKFMLFNFAKKILQYLCEKQYGLTDLPFTEDKKLTLIRESLKVLGIITGDESSLCVVNAKKYMTSLFEDTQFIKKAYEDTMYVKNYHFVNIDELQKNPKLWQMLQRGYQEHTLRLILKKLHNKGTPPSSSLDKKKKDYSITPLKSLSFIKEPLGKAVEQKLAEHARKISQRQYTQLDFTDPEYIRNMYTLFRRMSITQDQLVDALTILMFAAAFKPSSEGSDTLREGIIGAGVDSDPKNSFNLFASLEGQVGENLRKKFRLSVSSESPSDGLQTCFYMNFNKHFTSCFLFYLLNQFNLATYDDLPPNIKSITNQTVKRFIQRYALPDKKDVLLAHANDLSVKENRIPIMDFIIEQDPLGNLMEDIHRADYPELMQEYRSALFMAIPIAIGAPVPFLYESPQYDSNDPNSPLLCGIVLPFAILKNWIKTAFGETATMPLPLVGQLRPITMRDVDEGRFIDPGHFNRPVWLPHPDFQESPDVHNIPTTPWGTFLHDIYHLINVNYLMFQPLFRHINSVLFPEENTLLNRFLISKIGFIIVDRDTRPSPSQRVAILRGFIEEIKDFLINVLDHFFSSPEGNFFSGNPKDEVLLLLIDMVKNKNNIWKDELGVIPEEFFSNHPLGQNILGPLAKMEKIVIAYPNKSTLFYILLFRLNPEDSKVVDLCKTLEEVGYKNILRWERNDGLHLKKTEQRDSLKVSTLSASELFNQLVEALKKQKQSNFSLSSKKGHTLFSSPKEINISKGLPDKDPKTVTDQSNKTSPSEKQHEIIVYHV